MKPVAESGYAKICQACLTQRDVLSPLLSNFALENAIRRFQITQDGLKLNCIHQLLVYVGNVNILGGSVHAIKKTPKL